MRRRRNGCSFAVFILLLVASLVLLGRVFWPEVVNIDWILPQPAITTVETTTQPHVTQPAELSYAGSFRFHYSRLSEAEQVAYRAILEQLPGFPENVPVQDIDEAGVRAVFRALMLDQPLLFQISSTHYRIQTLGDRVTAFIPEYLMDREEYQRRLDKIAGVAESIPLPYGGSEFEIQLALHDFLVHNCTYSDDLADHNVSSAYGALVLGSASCEGYSKAMLLLLELNGIDAYIVTGYASNADFEGPHAWNKVRIDGNWYYLDATWNDPVMEGGREIVSRAFFNLSAENLAHSHELSDDGHNATSTAQNYFRVRGLLFDEINPAAESRLAQALVEALDAGRGVLELRMTSDEALQQARTALFGNQQRVHRILSAADPNGVRLQTGRVYFSTLDDLYVIRIFPVLQEPVESE